MMRDDPKTESELLRYLNALRSRAAQPEQAELEKQTAGPNESEQVFRAIFDNAADGIVLADLDDKKFYMANKAFCEMLGCDEDHFKDLGIADIHPAEDLPYVTEQFEKQAGGELALAKDIPVRRRDGSVFFADVNSFPITLGRKTYLMGIFRDMTEREQAKKSLAESEETARAFMNAITDTAVLTDAKLTILDINKAGAKKLGGSVGDIVGKNARDLFPAEVIELRRAKAAEVIRTGKTLRYEDEHAGMCFDTCICPVFDAQGKAERLAVFARDITTRKQLVQETAVLARFPEENPNPTLRISEDGAILYANKAGSSVLEKQGIHAGQSFREACRQHAKEALISGRMSTFEFNCDDGRTFLVTLAPVVEQGYLNAYALDITERKQAEVELKESEQRFSAIFDNAADGLLLADLETKKFYMGNRAICQMLGCNQDELKELGVMDIHPEEDLPYVMQVFERQARRQFKLAKDTPVKRKDGSVFFADINAFPITFGERTYLAGIFRDVTERKKAEEASRQSEQKWRSLAENAPDVIITADLDGTILFINRTAEPLTQEQVVGTPLYDYIPPEHRSTMRNAIEQVVRTGEPCGYELAGKGPGGRVSWYRSRIGPIKRDDQVVALTLIATDVTENKQMEQALRQSEQLYRSVVEDSPGMLCSFLPDGKVTFANAAYCEYFGKRSEELVGSDFKLLIPAENRQAVMDNILSLTVDSPSMTHEHKVIAPDGQVRWQRWINRAFFDEQGRTVRFQAFGEDITERRIAVEALRESELRYRTLFETLPVGVGLASLEGRILDANSTMLQMTGRSADQIRQINVRDTYDDPQERELFLEQLQRDGFVRDFEVRLKRKDGAGYYANVNATPVRLGDETVILTAARDVTAHKRAQEELAQSEQTLRSLVNSITESVMLLDSKGTVIAINESCALRLGASVDELMGKSIYDVLPPNVKELRRSMLEQVVRTCRPVQFEDQPPGRVVQNSLYPVLDGLGNVERVAVFGLDVTEQKSAEEKLRESEERLRVIFEGATQGILLLDPQNGKIINFNQVACETLGYTREEFQELTIADIDAIEPSKKILEHLQEILKNRGDTFETKHRTRDGAIRQVLVSSGVALIRGREHVVSIWNDVTDIKQAEEQIRTLSSAIEQSIDGIAIADLEARLLYVNEAYARMHGYAAEEMIGMKVASLHSNESMSEYNRAIHQITTQGAWAGELQHIRKDRTDFPVYLSATLLKDDKGQLVGSIGVCRDMTEYKRSQQMMMIKDAAIASSISGIAICDRAGNVTYANDSFLEMWGYENQQEVLGRNAAEFSQAPNHTQHVLDMMHGGQGWIGESIGIKKDGSPFDIQLCATTVADENGRPTAMMASFVDMTEYKRSQQMMIVKDAAMAASINAIVIGDVQGNLTYVNDSFLEMWGYEDENEVLGRNAAEFWQVNDQGEAIAEALKRGEGWIGELTARRKDGSPFDIQVCQTSIRDEDGTVISLMASFVDITESKRSSEELTLYREKMAHAEQLASLGSLSATVAHELTQPLTVIRLSLESALEKTERRSAPETITKKLKASLNQVSNIVALTERFRNFARKSSERTFRDVDLKTLAGRIMSLLGASARGAGIAVRLDNNMDELPPVHCHEKDMEQLFFALIDNAIRAAEGRKNRQLTVSGLVKDGHVELRFADDCGGIAPENLDRVFEPFFTTRPAGQGTGLGLCIVQEIVSRARGKVHAESKFGEGSTFVVTLPLGEDAAY